MGNMTIPFKFTGPISPNARRLAEQLCQKQATPKKGEQVRLNTLAVSFVNSYLQCMGFETDLEGSDSWDSVQRVLMDVADLSLKNLGKLECRPVLEGSELINIPLEVQSDRIGYLAVQISPSLREATLLGFAKSVSSECLSINQLQPLENFLEHLEELTQVNLAESVSQPSIPKRSLINLKQWFENIFDNGWHSIEALLETPITYPAWSSRSISDAGVCRGKLIDLGKQMTTKAVVLFVVLTPENDREMDIFVEVHPSIGQTYLPPNLHLIVLDSEGKALMEAQTRNNNQNIQLNFSGEVGERFSIKVSVGDFSIVEDFVI